jgi:hypothetical protein
MNIYQARRRIEIEWAAGLKFKKNKKNNETGGAGYHMMHML